MTVFTEWCKESGYDPEGVFRFKPLSIVDKINSKLTVKDELIIFDDDNTDCPRFETINRRDNNIRAYECLSLLCQVSHEEKFNNLEELKGQVLIAIQKYNDALEDIYKSKRLELK